MTVELTMMEAALFQLRAAVGDDPVYLGIRISSEVLANAVAAARSRGLDAARANDIAFALNDLVAATDDVTPPYEVQAAVAMLQNDAAALRAATALSEETVRSIRGLVAKLRARRTALERSQYRTEGSPAVELPHPPEELREEAIPLVRQLAAAGFETPALDSLVADPESVRYHTLGEIADELEVIAG